jgi:hypothetical protein
MNQELKPQAIDEQIRRRLLESELAHTTDLSRRKLILNAMLLGAARCVRDFFEEMKTKDPVPPSKDICELADWLVYKATPSDLRALAKLLELSGEKFPDKYRMALLDAYKAALLESDPGITKRMAAAMGLPEVWLDRFSVTNPLDCIGHIQSPPTFRRVRQEFEKRHAKKPETVIRKTLKAYGLEVKGKAGAPKGLPHVRTFR